MNDAVRKTTSAYTSFGALQSEDGPWDNDTISYSYTGLPPGILPATTNTSSKIVR